MSTRSRRVRIIKSSSDSDIENKGDEPKRKTIRGEESIVVDSYSTRSRRQKDGNTATHESMNSTTENAVQPKRQTRKKKILTVADNTLTENESLNKMPTKSTRSQAKIDTAKINPFLEPQKTQMENPALNTPASMTNERISTLRRIVETPRKVLTRRQSGSSITLATDTITPESSPMLVDLTPHRSTKTPKKSPMNIGSPKTHSQSPLKISKTPRKLTVSAESPATSDRSSVSVSRQSPIQANNSLAGNRCDPYVMLTDFKKDASPWTEIPLEFQVTSESPPSYVSTAKLSRKSPKNKPATASSSSTVEESGKKTSATSPKKKSLSNMVGTLGSKIRKSSVKTPVSIGKKIKVQTPMPNKTPKRTPTNAGLSNLTNLESPRRPKSTTKKRSPVTSSGTPLRPIVECKESRSKKKVDSPCPVAPKKIHLLLQLAESSPQVTPPGRIRRSLNLTPDFIEVSSGSTSSPLPTSARTGQPPLPPGSEHLQESKIAKDLSLELIDMSNFTNISDDVFENSIGAANGTYQLSNSELRDKETEELSKTLDKTEVGNATYELAEPKTPNLKRLRKGSLAKVELDKCASDAKRQCRVRFATPSKEQTVRQAWKSARKSLPTVNTPAKQRIESRLSRGTLGVVSSKRRSRSLTKIDEKPAAARSVIKRRSISASELTNKTPKLNQSTQNSVNRLSRPRQPISSAAKSEVKLPVPRKVPSFAQIHQKRFAEMESLVDAKKRVIKRHEELYTVPSTLASQSSSAIVSEPIAQQPSKKPLPTETQNGSYNRFGFKVGKAETIKVASKKLAATLRATNHRESNRTILKGVRINRRFELQMKARNNNL